MSVWFEIRIALNDRVIKENCYEFGKTAHGYLNVWKLGWEHTTEYGGRMHDDRSLQSSI